MRPSIPKLLVATLTLSLAPIYAEEGTRKTDSTHEARQFPQDLDPGARELFARLKVESVPNSPRQIVPIAFVRRLQPKQSAGKWTEHFVLMPGTEVEPNLHERVLRDFQ